ncbi:MAG TPA: hypothetical protein VHX42_02775 [Candidatus Babeliales bacterium]|jgi:hypothetical protein|nr:hypothetical protein [Candidatus Babeliales bacterium]
MYFIARNNKMYNYIAHTSLQRCYMATFFFVVMFVSVVFYCVYSPLLSHITVLQSEQRMLQKKVDELAQFSKNSKELSSFVETGKKNIADYAVASDKREEHCHKRMLFVMEAITKLGLVLNAYGSCKTQDKDWYGKDSAHFDVVGSLQKLLALLETIKNSRQMITISQVTLTRLADNSFQMSFDVGLVTIKR